jgi:hypothetical protein
MTAGRIRSDRNLFEDRMPVGLGHEVLDGGVPPT